MTPFDLLEETTMDTLSPRQPLGVGETPTMSEIPWPAKWRRSKFEALQSLSNLRANWDSYGASPIDSDAISSACDRLDAIALITKHEPFVDSSPSGRPLLTWTFNEGRSELELEFLPDGRILYSLTNFDDPDSDCEAIVPGLDEDLLALIPGA